MTVMALLMHPLSQILTATRQASSCWEAWPWRESPCLWLLS